MKYCTRQYNCIQLPDLFRCYHEWCLPQIFFAAIQLWSPFLVIILLPLDLTKKWGQRGLRERVQIGVHRTFKWINNFELAVKWKNEAKYTVIYLPCNSRNSDLTSDPNGSLQDFLVLLVICYEIWSTLLFKVDVAIFAFMCNLLQMQHQSILTVESLVLGLYLPGWTMQSAWGMRQTSMIVFIW